MIFHRAQVGTILVYTRVAKVYTKIRREKKCCIEVCGAS